MPVLFSALHRDMPLEGIRTMLESLEDCDDKLHRLFWLDSNVLHVALRHQCSVDVLRLLLEFGEMTCLFSCTQNLFCSSRVSLRLQTKLKFWI